MYGVVLWRDKADQKAVIWCEDHGDLAYFSADDGQGTMPCSFDPGDLVQFELNENEHIRFANNPMLVGQTHSRTLGRALVENSRRPRAFRQSAATGQVVRLQKNRPERGHRPGRFYY